MDLQNQARQLIRIVAHKTIFVENVAAYDLKGMISLPRFQECRMKFVFELTSRERIKSDLSRSVSQVLLSEFGADRSRVHDDVIEFQIRAVFKQNAQMVFDVKVVGLARLGHYVADIKLKRLRVAHRIDNTIDEEVRNQGRVQRAGTDRDDVRVLDRLQCYGQGPANPA